MKIMGRNKFPFRFFVAIDNFQTICYYRDMIFLKKGDF